jgi:hypothetical protein
MKVTNNIIHHFTNLFFFAYTANKEIRRAGPVDAIRKYIFNAVTLGLQRQQEAIGMGDPHGFVKKLVTAAVLKKVTIFFITT